jgi:uroporphyrinogen-III synthase
MLSAKEFRKLAEKHDVYAAIMDGYGHQAISGPVHKMVGNGEGVKAQWVFQNIPDSPYPYKYAFITTGNGTNYAFQLHGFEGNVLEVSFE